jgi:hypothetical protein
MNAVSEPREKAVPKYFRQTPKPPSYAGPIILTVIGALVVLGGLIMGIFFAAGADDASGIVCCAVPGFLAGVVPAVIGGIEFLNSRAKYKKEYGEAEPKPTDAQMDAWLDEDLARIKREAMGKLDLLPEQILGDPDAPIVVFGPANEAKWASGKDDIIRFSRYDILVVYLTSYHLAAYQCALDLASGTLLGESTQEYHYTDVVAVSTQAASSGLVAIMVDGKKKEIARYQKFALSVASGERIEVAVSFPQLEDIIVGAVSLAPTGAEKAISTIRAMLREKKGGVEEE